MKKEHSDEIHISSGTIVRAILIVLLFATVYFLRDLVLVVLVAVVLASAAEPAVRFFVRRNIPRLLSLVIIYVSAISLVGGLIYFFVPAILDDLSMVTRKISTSMNVSSVTSLKETAANSQSLASGVNTFLSGAKEGADLLDLFRNNIEEGNALSTATAFFGGFLSLILIIVLSFYLAAQEHGIENFLRLISPLKSRAYIIDLWKRSQVKIALWFQGQLLLGILVGVLAFLGLSVLGVSSALLLALLIALFELIPVFGPILAATPAVLIGFTEGIRGVDPGFTAATFVAIFYFILQQFESQLIYPLVVRKVVGIPPVLVILALVIGAKLAGFLGMVLAVPMTAVLLEFLGDIAKERRIYDDAQA